MNKTDEHEKFSYQPTLKRLMSTPALGEAQILQDSSGLGRVVTQVISTLDPLPAPGSLLVLERSSLAGASRLSLKELAGVIYVFFPHHEGITEKSPSSLRAKKARKSGKNSEIESDSITKHKPGGLNGDGLASLRLEPSFNALEQACLRDATPLIIVESFGSLSQMLDDIRISFLHESKSAALRVQSFLLATVLEEGLDGLVSRLYEWLDRPVAVESADFELLASRHMGSTPRRQQPELSLAATQNMRALQEQAITSNVADSLLQPIRLGRRATLPLVYASKELIGYISFMIRPTDKLDSLIWYLHSAALAAMVYVSQSTRSNSGISQTQISLLRDLLSGRNLSAAELEKIERHFGFDLYDGFFVFAVQLARSESAQIRVPIVNKEPMVGLEIEGTQVYVFPFMRETKEFWRQKAEILVSHFRQASIGAAAGRISANAALGMHTAESNYPAAPPVLPPFDSGDNRSRPSVPGETGRNKPVSSKPGKPTSRSREAESSENSENSEINSTLAGIDHSESELTAELLQMKELSLENGTATGNGNQGQGRAQLSVGIVQLGAGRGVGSLIELPEAYREARQALIIGSMIHGEHEFMLGYEELGVKRLLYLVIDHPELERFYKEVLGALELCDLEWESELVDSLRVYVEHGANLNSAARALYIHRHTLRYRLEQIADILKVDVDSEEVLLNFKIAFLIREMKGRAN